MKEQELPNPWNIENESMVRMWLCENDIIRKPVLIRHMPKNIAQRGLSFLAMVELKGMKAPLVKVWIGMPRNTSLSRTSGS